MKNGCLRGLPLASTAVGETCHSYHPWAGTRHRRESAALAKAPLPSTDSARALVMRSPIVTSLDHAGTRPQVSSRSWRVGSASVVGPVVAARPPGEHDGRLLGGRHVPVGLARRVGSAGS